MKEYEEKSFNEEKNFLSNLEKKHKENYLKALKNGLGEQINDPNSYIKNPSKIKIFFNKLNNLLNHL